MDSPPPPSEDVTSDVATSDIEHRSVVSKSSANEAMTPVRTNRNKEAISIECEEENGNDATANNDTSNDRKFLELPQTPSKDDDNEESNNVKEETQNDDSKNGSPPTLTDKAAPMLAKLTFWGKQANANALDFLNKRRVSSGGGSTGPGLVESVKKSLPLTTASLEIPSPINKASSMDQHKADAEAKEAETTPVRYKEENKDGNNNEGEDGKDETSANDSTRVPMKETSALLASAATPSPLRNDTDDASSMLSRPIPLKTVQTAPAGMLSMGSLLSPNSTRSGISDDASSFISYDDDTASSYWSSTYTSDDGMRGTLKWAAASVVDSMHTYRGRYNPRNRASSSDNLSDSGSPSTPMLYARTQSMPADTATSSQTHRMLQSRAKQHLQELMEELEPNEYLMLLGHGMLGVNLKPTYLRHGGVFVDFLVKGGAAQKSGVIRPGDSLCRIGDLDVRKGNILQVPGQIAQSRRPVHLIFATGSARVPNINYIDIATVLLRKSVETQERPSVVRFEEPPVVEEEEEEEEEENDNKDNSTSQDDDDTGSAVMELVQPTSFDTNENNNNHSEEKKVPNDESVPDITASSEGFLRPAVPPRALREAFEGRAGRRCNETFFRANRLWSTLGDNADANLLHAVKHAFALITADGRRLPFLVRQWSKQDQPPKGGKSADVTLSPETQIVNSPNAMLMLYLELFQFVDLYGVTPSERRREIAQKIANKFFLPIVMGNELIPPMLDFHHMVSDTSLRTLEAALKDESKPVTIDLFQDFQQSVVESLAGQPFLSFLVSDECSRMRAYMRNTAPYLNLPLDRVFQEVVENRNTHGKNYMIYVMVYLLSQTDPEEVGETNEIEDQKTKDKRIRVDDAAANLCAAIYIQSNLLPVIRKISEKKNQETMKQLFSSLEKFWEMFLSDSVGSLESTSLSAETRARVKMLRVELEQIGAPCRNTPLNYDNEESILTTELTAAQLTEPQLIENLESVAEGLLYDYAVTDHAKFRVHKIHEWMCQEARTEENSHSDQDGEVDNVIPTLSPDCIKRLLRRANFPKSVSTHKPFHKPSSVCTPARQLEPQQCTAECATVFGNSVGLDFAFHPGAEEEGVQRYACQRLGTDGNLAPEQLPPTLEAYATMPSTVYHQPLSDYENHLSKSMDGWELSLLSFKVPRADASPEDGEDAALYGASLVLRRWANYDDDDMTVVPTRVQMASSNRNSLRFEEGNMTRTVAVETECTVFNSRLQEQSWRKRQSVGNALVGVALVSRYNAIPSMRQALTKVVHSFSHGSDKSGLRCNGLADFLGNFSYSDVEGGVLSSFLQPYLEESLKPWIERPFGAQQSEFENEAGAQLIRSLPPIPLALLFITALLEQKIVITGSRRSVLLSATTALREMLKPLKWCHLLVPRVPPNLAADLLQYPAPFILGMPAQDPGIFDLIRELPEDITLVDLDVGRVILATSFAHNTELSRGTPKNESTARALRSQVLSLAQCLGNVFGCCMDASSWSCDRIVPEISEKVTPYTALKGACRSFIEELLAGTTSCCYWVEEAADPAAANTTHNEKSSDPTVLFDEDRFFRIKSERHNTPYVPLLGPSPERTKMALNAEGFYLLLEVFLRCQSMNEYIGSREREEMLFSL